MASPQYDQPMEDYHEEAMNPNVLEIPLLGEGEAVTLDLVNDLAEDPSELCVLLENEKCDREYWLAIGVCTRSALSSNFTNMFRLHTLAMDRLTMPSKLFQKDFKVSTIMMFLEVLY